MKNSKRAITLVEISLGVIIIAVLFTVIMKLLTSGMQGSTKGLANQANMETASIIMAQIEYDLLRASAIDSPGNNEKSANAKWNFSSYTSEGDKTITVTYDANASGGVNRKIDDGGKIQNIILGKDHIVALSFTHFQTTPVPQKYYELGKKYYRKHGMWVEVTVSTKNNKKIGSNESITLRRLIAVRNSI